MIKHLGSLGFYLRLNDASNKDYRLLEVFSSSAATNSLFSVDINNSVGQLLYSSSGVSCYVTGVTASAVQPEKWTHVTFSFEPPLSTYDPNSFMIRFGDSASCNFNIQNLYFTKQRYSPTEVEYLNQEFTGVGNKTATVEDTEVLSSINVIDVKEDDFISSLDNTIYQPSVFQTNFYKDISVATAQDITAFVSASVMEGDDFFFDNYQTTEGDTIFSLQTASLIYTVTASSTLSVEALSPGDFIRILNGLEYADVYYGITGSYTAQISPSRKKVVTFLNFFE